jgi:pimeloyl-ACP methyl ester carboxylesterase
MFAIDAWEQLGTYRELAGHRIFTVDAPPLEEERQEPLLILHGFPTASFDFHLVLDGLRAHRRVCLVDFLGCGLSAKPDIAYTLAGQADIVAAFTTELGLRELALLTHDMGDTVGGELLARNADGEWPVEITRRVLTNGSIYIEMAHLSAGQELLLSLPDERLAPGLVDEASVKAGVAGTFSPHSTVSDAELTAHAQLVTRDDGHLILPRLIRYIEERRRDQHRYTGAIEAHPSPLHVVWGADDPIAVIDMVDRLRAARPDTTETTITILDRVGHYPMIEAPGQFLTAVTGAFE